MNIVNGQLIRGTEHNTIHLQIRTLDRKNILVAHTNLKKKVRANSFMYTKFYGTIDLSPKYSMCGKRN